MTIFEEYAQVYRQIKELEAKKEDLQLRMFDIIEEDGQTFKENDFGGFYITGRRTYDYSDNVKDMEKRVRQIKKQEEAQGIALLKSHSQHIRFLSPEALKKQKEDYWKTKKYGGGEEQNG